MSSLKQFIDHKDFKRDQGSEMKSPPKKVFRLSKQEMELTTELSMSLPEYIEMKERLLAEAVKQGYLVHSVNSEGELSLIRSDKHRINEIFDMVVINHHRSDRFN